MHTATELAETSIQTPKDVDLSFLEDGPTSDENLNHGLGVMRLKAHATNY